MSGEAFRKYAVDLARAAAGLDSSSEKAALKAAKSAALTARSIVPVESGELRDSIKAWRLPSGDAAVGAWEYYGLFQEYGTSRMAPNPFLGPAVERATPVFLREVGAIADDVAEELS